MTMTTPDRSDWSPRSRASWIREAQLAGNAHHVRHAVPWRHNLLNLSCTTGVLVAILVLGWSSQVVPWYLYLPLGSFLGGCLFFALFIQVVHEASHEMYLLGATPAQTRTWNRRVGRLMTMLLFTNWKQHWEEGHLVHHLHPMEPVDPQIRGAAADGRDLFVLWLKLLTVPLYVFRANPSANYGIDPVRLSGALVFWAIAGTAGAWAWSWTLPLVVLGSFHTTLVLSLLRENQEHASGLQEELDPACRSRSFFYPLRHLLIPFNMNYHFEHHLHFKVPWYSLPRYHRDVRRIMPGALHPYFFTDTFRDFVAQVNGTRDTVPAHLRHMLVREQPST